MKANGEMIQFLKQRDYEMINNNLGSGSFGQTVLLKDPFIDELFVAKKYEPYYDEDKKEFFDSFLQEIKIMYKLNHKNIVRIYNYYPYENVYTGYIIMEYIEGTLLKNSLEFYSLFGDGPVLMIYSLSWLMGLSILRKREFCTVTFEKVILW